MTAVGMSATFCSPSSRRFTSTPLPAEVRHARPRFAKASASRFAKRLAATSAAARKYSEARQGSRAISYSNASSAATAVFRSTYAASNAPATLLLHEARRDGDNDPYSAL